MKGDFSRQTFDPRKHYSGVLMQQGRVQTDADWNEQEAIGRRRTQLEARDVIGPCGGPEDAAGFGVAIVGTELTIGAGRYYVDGLLAENEVDGVAFEDQPDLPGADDWLAALTKAKATNALVYLDVWERHITPLDDALLREVALGGPDTATRVKTVWQLRVLPVDSGADPAKVKALVAKRAAVQKKLIEVQASGGDPVDIAELQAELAKLDAQIAAASGDARCDSDFGEWDDLVADPERTLNARTQPPTNPDGPCVVPPTAGYRRLENQLYRVEVHGPGAPGVATFKWSRDNGSVVTTIEKISGKDVTVHDLGPDDILGFATGQWIEISDDAGELAGAPGQLAQIDTINESLRRITLKAAPTPLAVTADGVDPARHPKLRRWDQSGTTATASGVGTTAAWLPLEDGVEIQLSGVEFRTGDYWVIPARTATGEIEWPPFAIPNIAPEPQARRGIAHHYCRLALLEFDASIEGWAVAEDCRRLFPPLTETCCEPGSLHVVGTNWPNDDVFATTDLATTGLRVTLDGPPDPASLTNDTVQVILEAPFGTGDNASPDLRQRLYLRGIVGRDPADDTVIVWKTRPTAQPAPGMRESERGGRRKARAAKAEAPTRAEGIMGVAPVAFTLVDRSAFTVRVVLKGGFIWNDASSPAGDGPPAQRVLLDGQATGRPGLRADGTTPRIDLAYPSGHAAVASDFESWFFVGGAKATTLQVSQLRFLTPNGTSSSAGTVTPPVGPNQPVLFKAGESIQLVEITFNRAINQDSLGPGTAPTIFVGRQDPAGGVARLAGDLKLQSETVVMYIVRDPQIFLPGNYVLTCLGGAAGTPGIRAADDGSALDGDYDGTAGGDLALSFQAL
jgi:hypothetical protein